MGNEFDEVFAFYKQHTNKEIPNIEIVVKEDMVEAMLEYEENIDKRKSINEQREILANNNGITCYPNKKHEAFYIILNAKIFGELKNKDYQIFCTIFHEITHAIDFYNFAKAYCDSNYNFIELSSSFPGFYYWTEYNAKKVSYQLYSILMLGKENYFSCERKEHILNVEVKYQNENLREYLLKYQDDYKLQLYYIVQYLARYSIWEEIDKKSFENCKLMPEWLLSISNELEEVYNLFVSLPTFDVAKENFDKIEEYLNKLNK